MRVFSKSSSHYILFISIFHCYTRTVVEMFTIRMKRPDGILLLRLKMSDKYSFSLCYINLNIVNLYCISYDYVSFWNIRRQQIDRFFCFNEYDNFFFFDISIGWLYFIILSVKTQILQLSINLIIFGIYNAVFLAFSISNDIRNHQ